MHISFTAGLQKDLLMADEAQSNDEDVRDK
jgi:hypothetical protein